MLQNDSVFDTSRETVIFAGVDILKMISLRQQRGHPAGSPQPAVERHTDADSGRVVVATAVDRFGGRRS